VDERGLRRRFLAIVLVLGLLFAAIVSSGLLSSDKPPVAVAREFKPSVSVPEGVDVDRNRVDDRLDSEIAGRAVNGTDMEPTNVIVMLNGDSGESAAATFKARGGNVTTEMWRYALYGFGGRIPFGLIVAFVNSRSDVLLVEREAECHAVLAYAAKQVGARPYVWDTLGLRGDANSSVVVLDTGIDGSHVDFAPGYGAGDFSKKIVGWNNQVTSASTPVDDNGHGSHCSGLAAGDGFFSVNQGGYATATWGANLGNIASNIYFVNGFMVNGTGPITVSVRWAKTATRAPALSSLSLYYGDKTLNNQQWTSVDSVSTSSQDTWYSFSYDVASMPSGGYDMYHIALTVARPFPSSGSLYVNFNVSWPYTPPTDGFSGWTGTASDSKLVGVKVLDSTGGGTDTQLLSGLNWLIANRVAYHVTVASMSLGFSIEVSSVNAAIVNLVNSGVSTVVAAGNSGSGTNYIYTPGSVDEALTVAAMNPFDGIASYSSQGGTSRYSGATVKPDVTAPGGSFYAVPLFSADSNTNDADGRWSDVVANDAAPMQGTSMATPVVAGSAQILVEALGGSAGWSYTRSQALLPKMLLLMTATETYPNARESGTSPTLERGGKDVQEGYGRINVDAAVDAVLKQYLTGTAVVDSLGVPPKLADISVLGQRLCWARNVQLFSGITYSFSLSVPAGADYDLYLYDSTGTAYGEPVIKTKSVSSALGGDESISYTPASTGKYYLVVKRATETSGGGEFALTSTPSQTAHLLLNVEPNQAVYARGQSLTFQVTVFNELSPALESTLALTVTGPGGYYHYDFQPIALAANEVKDCDFSWAIPQTVGTYVAEVGLIPAQLTAYDAVWLNVA
jgi:subtilisin family serine protease